MWKLTTLVAALIVLVVASTLQKIYSFDRFVNSHKACTGNAPGFAFDPVVASSITAASCYTYNETCPEGSIMFSPTIENPSIAKRCVFSATNLNPGGGNGGGSNLNSGNGGGGNLNSGIGGGGDLNSGNGGGGDLNSGNGGGGNLNSGNGGGGNLNSGNGGGGNLNSGNGGGNVSNSRCTNVASTTFASLNVGAPPLGWSLSTILQGGTTINSSYPSEINDCIDPNFVPSDGVGVIPYRNQLLLEPASGANALVNRGCPTGAPVDCVDYLSNGGKYPNCDVNTYGFTCGLPRSLKGITTRMASPNNNGFTNDASYNLYTLVYTGDIIKYGGKVSSFTLHTPTAQAWSSKFGQIGKPTKLIFPIRYDSLSLKTPVSLPQLTPIRDNILIIEDVTKPDSGSFPMPDDSKTGEISYSWYFDGVKRYPSLIYVTPSSITNPDKDTYGHRLQGLSLEADFPADGSTHEIEISVGSTILIVKVRNITDYGFVNGDDSYSSIQTIIMSTDNCLESGNGRECRISQMPSNIAYCRADMLANTMSCFSKVP